MKHLFLLVGAALLWLSTPSLSLAQRGSPTALAAGGGGAATAEPDPRYTVVVDSLLQLLDKSLVPAGILYDRAWPLAALHAFSTSRDTSNYRHFRQAHEELYRAAYHRAGFRLTPELLAKRTSRLSPFDAVPLGVLDYQFWS